MPHVREIAIPSAVLVALLGVSLFIQLERSVESSSLPAVTVPPSPPSVTAPPSPPVVTAPPSPPVVTAPPSPPVVTVPPTPPAVGLTLRPTGERDPAQAMLMLEARFMVSTRPDLSWSEDQVHHRFVEDGVFQAWKPADAARLPAPLQTLSGARFNVYRADGSACVATLRELQIYAENHELELGDEFITIEDLKAMGQDAQRKVATQLLATPQFLLGEQGGSTCEGLWARRADLPPPALFGERVLLEDEAAALAARARPILRAQPEYAALKGAYLAYTADPENEGSPSWYAWAAKMLSIRRWDEIGGPRRIVSVDLGEPDEACRSMFTDHVVLLFLDDGDRLVRLQTGWKNLAALMDIDRDGTLEGVTEGLHDLWTLESGSPVLKDSFQRTIGPCPC